MKTIKTFSLLLTGWVLQSCSTIAPLEKAEAQPEKYCTVSQFYFLGEMGFPAKTQNCPAGNKAELIAAHDKGKELLYKKNRAKELRQQITKMEEDNSLVADVGRVTSLFSGKSPTQDKETELVTVETQMNDMIAKAPDSVEYCDYEMAQKDQVKKVMPAFLMDLSSEVKTKMNGCSRIVR